MIKFKAGPTASLAASSVGFGSFDGMTKACVRYSKAKGGVLRCAKFQKGKKHPVCPKGLKDGGRSPGLIRAAKCAGGKSAPKRAARKATRRTRRARK